MVVLLEVPICVGSEREKDYVQCKQTSAFE